MHSHLTRSKIAKNNEFYTQYADVATEIEHYLQATPELFRDKCVYLPADCALYAHSAFYRYFKENFTRFGLRKLIAVGYNALTDECGAKRGFCYTLEREVLSNAPKGASRYDVESDELRVTSENAQEVGESLAEARLCRGEACLARRIDVENNRNTCAAHTAGEARLAPTIAPQARTRDVRAAILVRFTEQARALEGDGDFRSEECRPFWQEADFIITNPPFSLLSHFTELLVAYNKRYLFIGPVTAMTYKRLFQQILLQHTWFGGGKPKYFITPSGQKQPVNCQWYTNLYHEVPNKPLPTLRTMAENKALYSSRKDAPKGAVTSDESRVTSENTQNVESDELRVTSENTQNVESDELRVTSEKAQEAESADTSNFKLQTSNLSAKRATLYKPYDNYEAIEVPRIEYIPSDYYGPMGVPITILPFIIHPQKTRENAPKGAVTSDELRVTSANAATSSIRNSSFVIRNCREAPLAARALNLAEVSEFGYVHSRAVRINDKRDYRGVVIDGKMYFSRIIIQRIDSPQEEANQKSKIKNQKSNTELLDSSCNIPHRRDIKKSQYHKNGYTFRIVGKLDDTERRK